MLKFSVLVPPTRIEEGEKCTVTTGGATPVNTVSVAVLLVAPGPLSLEVMAPVVLLFVSATASVTTTPKLHDPPGASDAPVRFNDVEPGDPLFTEPEQLLNAIAPVI